MTFSTDPPLISDLSLIPGTDQKADLNAPAGSGGKLVIGQAPNITITETTVVADAAERLALDVQEGDVAIQTNVSTSFIFTGGDNVAPNWQAIDFDAVGAIAGEDIAPGDVNASGDVTASGNMSMQDLSVAGAINGADTSAASAGEALTSNGSGSLQFASVGGADPLTFSENDLDTFVNNVSDIQTLLTQPVLANAVFSSFQAMDEITNNASVLETIANDDNAVRQIVNSVSNRGHILNSSLATEKLAASEVFVEKLGTDERFQNEALDNPNAVTGLNNAATTFSESDTSRLQDTVKITINATDKPYPVLILSGNVTNSDSGNSTHNFYDENGNTIGKTITNEFYKGLQFGHDGTPLSGNLTITANVTAVIP